MQYPSPRFTLTKVAAAVILYTSGMAMADENKAEHSNIFTLGTVVVTADAITTAESSESFIDRETIELLEAKDVGEALQYTPGALYNYAQGGRYESDIIVRGYSLRYMPIYLDGIPVYIPYDGNTDLGRFKTADISSIQVAKGYSSVMYGPNAMGGAINLVTLKPRSELDISGTIGGGQGGQQQFVANVGTLQELWYLQAGIADYKTRYTRLAHNFVGVDAAGQKVDSNKYLYHTKDRRANIKLGFTPNATDEYVLSYSKQKAEKYPGGSGKNGFVPTTWKWPKWDRETISFVSQTWLLNDKVYIKPRIYHDTYKNTLVGWRGDPKGSHYDDQAFGASLEVGTTLIDQHLIKMMLSYKDETHKSFDTFPNSSVVMPNSFSKASQKFYSIALEDTITFNEQWEAQIGFLYTKRKAKATDIGINTQNLIAQYPAANSMLAPSIDAKDYQAALFYKPTEQDTFRASIAHRTRFPSFKEVYSNYATGKDQKCPAGQTGCQKGERVPSMTLQNPGLKPESGMNYEIGYNGTPMDGLNLEATLFYSQSKDKIERSEFDFNTFPGYAVRQSINLPGKVDRKGIELGIDYRINQYVQIGGSYTYLEMKRKDDSSLKILDIPKHYGYLYASIKPIDWVEIVPSMTARSYSYASVDGHNRNSGYALYNLKLSVTPPQWKGVTFNVGVDNIFNKNHSDYNAEFASPGRSVYANMRIDFY
ncbi:TonB-dependent receptor plug domain-containing protein [Wohlfahrtiimonas chitiniclastica]|uniref:TonB-dependent receptor plug domain-containing protein n=1 Tax=Wohlfahrtiimonas chitiniclastica TaxID=400946 RepID=UPI001BCD2C58|nr:TonB-dependent receptor [Wohlfahrtiimonas chitiniclastica]MBS7816188.1 TonB-dependent receptor [Wohlfahrtiimonas chitiniclastica]MBS7821817.1 TonB-dependent receptor [Wohlfahrtiimonas chitiniclastica]MBS7829609.1 TonB-dependent receptor [Wohlfahrtiimonas chitiniclastica]MBS7831576.1 TonB-dependent receptor [Wohlfahrtiimonas chitiniclastica]